VKTLEEVYDQLKLRWQLSLTRDLANGSTPSRDVRCCPFRVACYVSNRVCLGVLIGVVLR
jgi:hypothetical protein